MALIIKINGEKLKLTNLNKVLYRKTGFTKGQVIDYYKNVSSYILPHLKDRPITLKRFPNGVENDFFYEKQCPSFKPDWLKTLEKGQMSKNYCLINDLPSLIWIANLASIELHTLLVTKENVSRPTMLVFDLDPGQPATLLNCLEISLIMRDMLSGLGLKCFAKTSGGKGLHFYLPLNTEVTYDQTKFFAKAVAQVMEKNYPDRIVSKMDKSIRKGKVFIDWSQNTQHKTTVCVYSLRAQPTPTVSMPVSWEQVEKAITEKNAESLIYDPAQALETLKKQGDIFAEVLTLKQKLPYDLAKNKTLNKPASLESKNSKLSTYQKKRDFTKTPEPPSRLASRSKTFIFVIHKHAARKLHYDLRLEVHGVLKSWAVPKGPSSSPAEKRLAVQTEDHPFGYKDFEGTIPAGQYGAGLVIIWDRGTYKNVTVDSKNKTVSADDAIENGKLEIVFEGEKIKGKYSLVRLKRREGDDKSWLLIKSNDKYVNSLPEDLETIGESVIVKKRKSKTANANA